MHACPRPPFAAQALYPQLPRPAPLYPEHSPSNKHQSPSQHRAGPVTMVVPTVMGHVVGAPAAAGEGAASRPVLAAATVRASDEQRGSLVGGSAAGGCLYPSIHSSGANSGISML